MNTYQKKAGAAILISDKVNFRPRKMIRDKELIALHYDRGVNSQRRPNNLKCECTLQESAKIREIKADRTKRRNKQIHC